MATNMTQAHPRLWEEYVAQSKSGGITGYFRWLELRVDELERDLGHNRMAAEINHEQWVAEKAKREHLAAAVAYLRDWLLEDGSTLALRVLDGCLEYGED